ncbi:MAG: NUDIX domain-containing protein [Candidatus Saccharimonadales bacterium]
MKIVQKAGGIVLNPKDEVLIIKNDLGRFTLPKGGLEPGETHIEAAEREILEEGGISKVTVLKELGTIVRNGYTKDNHDSPSVVKHIRIYLCKTTETALSPKVEDVLAAYWVNKDEVAKTLSWAEEAEFFINNRSKIFTQ